MRTAIDAFFRSDEFGVVGVSADRKKFGNVVYRALRERGLTVFPVHTSLDRVEGDRCFQSVRELPPDVRAVVTVVPPAATEQVVEDCVARGVSSLWMQQGSESAAAIAAAGAKGIAVVHGKCILMFLEPVRSVHAFHRGVLKLFGKYPR
jgi:predicted CoA-binding protein